MPGLMGKRVAALVGLGLVATLAVFLLLRGGGEREKKDSPTKSAGRATPAARTSSRLPGHSRHDHGFEHENENDHEHEPKNTPPPTPNPAKRAAYLAQLAAGSEAAQAEFAAILDDQDALWDAELVKGLLALA